MRKEEINMSFNRNRSYTVQANGRTNPISAYSPPGTERNTLQAVPPSNEVGT